MEGTMKRFIACIALAALCVAAGCSYENTATVTIDTGIRQQAQLNWFDRVIALLSFSQPLQADPVPELPHSITQITLFIKAPDMEAIAQDIPLDSGKITLEVPAGSQRTFEIVAYTNYDLNSDGSFHDRYYGGMTTVDLAPGQEVNLNIEMGELPVNFYFNINASEYILQSIQFDNLVYNIRAVKIYDTNKNLLHTIIVSESMIGFVYGQTVITLNKVLPRGDYYASAVNDYGEGELYQFWL